MSAAEGDYSFPALSPGEYQVDVEVVGFQRIARWALVEAGITTRADFALRVGDLNDSVTVPAASAEIHYDSATVGGVINRDQIQALPLNGRTFLELAKLEPGVQPPTAANRNRTVVAILGGPAANVGGARFTIDGGSVTSVGLGGSQLGLSQEAVQEFQIATVNFDLSTGMTDAGAINVVTRAGGNEPHASAFYFFRDHNLAAYPALKRDRNNPEPFFERHQFGFAARRSHSPQPRFLLWKLGAKRSTRSCGHDAAGGGLRPLEPDHGESVVGRSVQRPRSTQESMVRTLYSFVTLTMAARRLDLQRRQPVGRRMPILRTGTAS